MNQLIVATPRITHTAAPARPFTVEAGQTYTHLRVVSADFTGTAAPAVDIAGSTFEHTLFAGAALVRFGLVDCTLKRCDLATADCSELSFLRVAMTDGRMTGWDANQGTLEDVTFQGCKLDMANFRAAKLTRVRFIDCLLTEADFLGATLTNVAFEHCILEKVELSQCTLSHVDFRTSQLIDIAGWQYLKGAVLDSVQLATVAPYLANTLGIVIDDER